MKLGLHTARVIVYSAPMPNSEPRDGWTKESWEALEWFAHKYGLAGGEVIDLPDGDERKTLVLKHLRMPSFPESGDVARPFPLPMAPMRDGAIPAHELKS